MGYFPKRLDRALWQTWITPAEALLRAKVVINSDYAAQQFIISLLSDGEIRAAAESLLVNISGLVFSAVTMGSPWWWPLLPFNNTNSNDKATINQKNSMRDSLKINTSTFGNAKDSTESN